MKNKLINELAYIALIAVTLMCFACLDSEIVTNITMPNPEEGSGGTVGSRGRIGNRCDSTRIFASRW